MVYDCFSFFNELDLLEIRLNVLKDVVDRFVLVEAVRTHTGKEKPLFFKENEARFAEFSDRIIHITVTDFSSVQSMPESRRRAWFIENLQRNSIVEGLSCAKDDDVVMISDVDEIPKPEAVKRAVSLGGVVRLGMKSCNYYLNYCNCVSPNWKLGTQVLKFSVFKNPATYRNFKFSEFVLEDMEDILISADLGVGYASELTDKLRKQNKIKPSQVKEFLQNEFIKTLNEAGSSELNYKENELNNLIDTKPLTCDKT